METSMMSSDGRITRTTYWSRWFLAFVINILGSFLSASDESLAFVGLIISIPVVIFIIIQGIKRMHDVDKSGWYIIFPIYNLILAFTDGTVGPNKYGDDPKEREVD